ncbi:MAG TPA: family 16 glycoside hydrolase [Isosphaeraceae bacterium]|jgi:predicted esterase/prenyltransferase beta subunit|nr:family 16 glycoside hydrolase [Isosphaeraceae bacterium]
MRRILSSLAIVLLVVVSSVRAQTPADLAQTASYLAAFQNPDGGFAGKPGGASSLGSTSTGIRTLEFAGGSVKDVPAAIAYVKSCFDSTSGGFAPTPGGKPDVPTTAIGLMAVSALKIPADEMVEKALKYLADNAKTFEEVRMGAAGYEAVKKTSPIFEQWTAKVNADRNPDGTWGSGAGQAFATGGAAAALLRMGVKLDKKDAVVAAMRAGQRPDGGWSKDENPSDLGSSYRIMRCFYMLKEQPDIDKLRGFIARCRQSDGGYGVKPGAQADLGGTYNAMIITRWTRQLTGEPTFVETASFAPLFNGKDLNGWEGDTSLWSARDGMLVGHSNGLQHNDFLATTGTYADFILKATFRLVDNEGNSGIQFRSVRVPGHEMSGYQADVGQQYWGCLYDESRRNKVLKEADPKAVDALHKTGWNQYVVRAMGNKIITSLNGVTSVNYTETDDGIARDGRIALQMHAGGPMEVQFKDLYIQALPSPKADLAPSPGFHLRTVKAPDGDRKYTVYLPTGYDGSKEFPVVLFLHGAGERGDDGIICAQVGLGAAIAQQPEAYPMIVVFPQARRTWQDDSDDAKGALAALDEVLKTYKVDKSRVVLTGLSMGGAGSWSIGSAHPERFSAVVPVCGFARPETVVAALKDKPVWTFLGDADSERIAQSTRALGAALRDAGSTMKATEYRGVGHNSWDRAYTDATLIDWMLNQKRKDTQ